MRKLSIIILQHNTPEFVTENLQSLDKCTLPPDTHIVVINNGGNNANAKIDTSKLHHIKPDFYEIPNTGFPAGNNFGLSKTQAQNYAFINPDIVVNPDTFIKLLNYLEQNPGVGIISPQLVYPDGTIQDNYRVFPRVLDLIIKRIPLLRKKFTQRMRNYLMWNRNPDESEAVDWVTGAFIIVRHDCMSKLKKHDDDRYFIFMSDVAICREAYKLGYETHIVGQVKCLHNDQRVSHGSIRDIFKSKIIRIHIKDAISYFWHYLLEPIPKNAPSQQKDKKP
jgi:GT2 family glycosyltransferase